MKRTSNSWYKERSQQRQNWIPPTLFTPPVWPDKTAPRPLPIGKTDKQIKRLHTGELSHKAEKVLRQMLNGRTLIGNDRQGYRLEYINDLGKCIATKVKAGIVKALKASLRILFNGIAWLLTEAAKRAVTPSKFGKAGAR